MDDNSCCNLCSDSLYSAVPKTANNVKMEEAAIIRYKIIFLYVESVKNIALGFEP